MENFINEAKNFMASDQGKQMESMIEKTTGFSPSSTDNSASGSNDPSASYGGNSGSNQSQQSFGGAQQQSQPQQRPDREQDYTGYGEEGDSSISSGGYGANNQGDSYSRQNQMGADFTSNARPESSDAQRTNYDAAYTGSATGTSTPAYRQEDDGYGGSPIGGSTRQLGDGGRQSVGAGQTQGGGGSSGLNPYGDNTNGEEPEI